MSTSTGITPNDIEKFAKRVVSYNKGTVGIAQSITKKNNDYNKSDTEDIILSHLRRSKYSDNKIIDRLAELHPDMPIFQVYFSSKVNKKQQESDKLDCLGCAAMSHAEGEDIEVPKKIKKQGDITMGLVYGGLFAVSLLLLSQLKD